MTSKKYEGKRVPKKKSSLGRRALSVFLAVMMCVSVLNLTVFAETIHCGNGNHEGGGDRIGIAGNGKELFVCKKCGEAVWRSSENGNKWHGANKSEGNVIEPEACKHPGQLVTTPATCTKDGQITGTCVYCGKDLGSEVITAPGHNWSEWADTCVQTDDGHGLSDEHSRTCQNEFHDVDVDGAITETDDHNYNSGVKQADGSTKYTCKDCGHYYVVAKTEPEPPVTNSKPVTIKYVVDNTEVQVGETITTGQVVYENGGSVTVDGSANVPEGYELADSVTTTAEATYDKPDVVFLVKVKELPPQTKTITLSYDANGGTGAPAAEPKTVNVGETATFDLTEKVAVWEGHTFLGWTTKAASISYVGAEITVGEDTTLYAQWKKVETEQPEPEKMIVQWVKGYGSATSATIKHITIAVDADYADEYPEDDPVREGYKFTGWSEPEEGKAGDGQKVITITAQWAVSTTPLEPATPLYYVVIHYVDSKSWDSASDTWTKSLAGDYKSDPMREGETYKVESPKIKGYDLEYASDAFVSGTVNPEKWGSSTLGENMLESWVTYTRLVNVRWMNGYSATTTGGQIKSINIKDGADYSSECPDNPVREGYKFTGWSAPVESKAGDGQKVITITAQWTPYTTPLENIQARYIVQWLDQDDNVLKQTVRGPEAVGTKVEVGETDKGFKYQITVDGNVYTFDADNAKNVLEGTLSKDGVVTLKLYFTKTAVPTKPMVVGDQVRYIVQWLDEAGNELKTADMSRTGKIGNAVSATDADKADITKDGSTYKFNAAKSTASGELKAIASADDIVTLTLYFTKNAPVVQPVDPTPTPSTTYFNLTINYVDVDGNVVAAAHSQRLASGRSYTVPSPEIEGMVADKLTVTGTLTRNTTITVTYYALEEPVFEETPPLAQDPTEDPTEELEDPNVPLAEDPTEDPAEDPAEELEDPNVPLAEDPTEDPAEELEDPNVPLAEDPAEEPTEELEDPSVPLDESPETSDSTHIALWSGVLLASGLGLMVMLAKKKEEEEA